jgi:hypothetical protein
VPVWHDKAKTWREDHDLVLLGVTQEQHPQRCRLFAQWKQLDWPILHDPINVIGCSGVPVVVAIDERGIVRSVGPKIDSFEEDFLERTFPGDDSSAAVAPVEAARPDLARLRQRAEQGHSAEGWRRFADAQVLWGEAAEIDVAIDAYDRAIRIAPDDADAHFRLGTCYRIRYDSARRKSGDFQAAAEHWSRARDLRPNWYIWRRRIEQYGPRLIKPYPFYDWVATANQEILARGERPVLLPVTLSGAEVARPSRRFEAVPASLKSPDPDGRIHRDRAGLVVAEVTIVPPRIPPGGTARVHVTLRPSPGKKTHWNNEGEPTRLWIDPPPGWQVAPQQVGAPQAARPETTEPRHLEFELRAPATATGRIEVPAYALYYVCEDAGGTCRFLRQDIVIPAQVVK